MKKFLLAFGLFIFLVNTQLFAQLDERKVLCLKKIETYKRMRNTGFIMTGLGVASFVVGVSIIDQEDKNYNSTNNIDEGRLATGVVCAVLGVPLTAGGLVLGLIGSHKVGKYKKKLDNLSFNVNYSPYRKGLTMRYTF